MRGCAVKRLRGFSLIELMIVIVIIAILAAIAIPTWQRYVYRSRRPDGQELLLRIAQAEERYYTNYNHYPATLASIYPTAAQTSEHGYYVAGATLPAGSAAGTAFIAVAVPQPPQNADVCGNLSIDNTGAKKPNSTNTAANSNGPCWGN